MLYQKTLLLKALDKCLKAQEKERLFCKDSNFKKLINFAASFQINSLLFKEDPDESIPQSFTPLMMKGITLVFIFIPPALPQAATIPPGLVCAKIFC